MHALAHGAGHYLIDIVVRCLFGGVALNAKAGIRATVEKRGHRCFIGPRRLSRLLLLAAEHGGAKSSGGRRDLATGRVAFVKLARLAIATIPAA